jgi:hypothetical protein
MMKTNIMNKYWYSLLLAVLLIGSVGLGSPKMVRAGETTLRSPECSEIQKWVGTIDLADVYQPLEEAPYDKLPKAYGSEAFAELFGKPALEWTRAELGEMYNYILKCGKNEGRDYRKKVRPLSRNLKKILIVQSQKN